MNITEKIDKYLNEQENVLFTDKGSAKELAYYFEKSINAPVIKASVSTLGGTPTVLMKISLDEKKDWPNNILENSRWFQVRVDPDPSKSNLEMYTKSHKIDAKFRKQKAKSKEEVVKKLNNFIKKAS